MTHSLNDKAVLIYGRSQFGDALGASLGSLGATVTSHPAAQSGNVDLVVIPVVDPGVLAPTPLGDMGEAEWIARCEALLTEVKDGFKRALELLGKGGHIILLIPSSALSGSENLVAYSAAAEGARLLAKAVARAEGANGIVVNTLALSPELLNPGGKASSKGRVAQALPAPDAASIAAFIATLANAPQVMTGATILLNGGEYMWV